MSLRTVDVVLDTEFLWIFACMTDGVHLGMHIRELWQMDRERVASDLSASILP